MAGAGSSGVSSSEPLAFLQEPSDVIAVRERPLMLHCQVEGEGPISITWRRNGVPVEVDGGGARTTLLANGTLLIRSFSKKREQSEQTDAGEYECAAQNRYGMLVSRKARVLLACESHDLNTHTLSHTRSAHCHSPVTINSSPSAAEVSVPPSVNGCR